MIDDLDSSGVTPGPGPTPKDPRDNFRGRRRGSLIRGERKRGETKPRFDAIKQTEYLRVVREEKVGRIIAARRVGVDPKTVRRHIELSKSFAAAVSRAEMEGQREKIEAVEDALYQSAVSGNVVAIQVFLYNRASDRWADKRNVRQEISGTVSVYHGPAESFLRRLDEVVARQVEGGGVGQIEAGPLMIGPGEASTS